MNASERKEIQVAQAILAAIEEADARYPRRFWQKVARAAIDAVKTKAPDGLMWDAVGVPLELEGEGTHGIPVVNKLGEHPIPEPSNISREELRRQRQERKRH